MSADIVNLNKARKERARSEARRRADENRRRFGQSKAERTKSESERAAVDKTLDGAHRTSRTIDEGDSESDEGQAP